MKKTLIRKTAAAFVAAGLAIGITAVGAAPASADSSWGYVLKR